MKVAVVTDDGTTISQHFGRAAYYEVLTLENGSVTGRERREKPAHHHHHEHGTVHLHQGSDAAVPLMEAGDAHSAMVGPVQDCLALISRGMGHGAYESLRGAGIEPIITDVKDIDEAVRQYLNGELVDHPERLH
jgi:predicted Fe-Mo cluster-binding NifX family protein